MKMKRLKALLPLIILITSAMLSSCSEKLQSQEESRLDNCISAKWAKEVFTDLSHYETIKLGMNEKAPLVFFSTEKIAKDFRLLTLSLKSVDEEGNIKFNIEEAYYYGTMTAENPLLARMELMGTIPNNGFSYVDMNEATRYFTIEVSGYDGSLILNEFEP